MPKLTDYSLLEQVREMTYNENIKGMLQFHRYLENSEKDYDPIAVGMLKKELTKHVPEWLISGDFNHKDYIGFRWANIKQFLEGDPLIIDHAKRVYESNMHYIVKALLYDGAMKFELHSYSGDRNYFKFDAKQGHIWIGKSHYHSEDPPIIYSPENKTAIVESTENIDTNLLFRYYQLIKKAMNILGDKETFKVLRRELTRLSINQSVGNFDGTSN